VEYHHYTLRVTWIKITKNKKGKQKETNKKKREKAKTEKKVAIGAIPPGSNTLEHV